MDVYSEELEAIKKPYALFDNIASVCRLTTYIIYIQADGRHQTYLGCLPM